MSSPATPQPPSKPEIKQRSHHISKPSSNTSDISSVNSTVSQNTGNVKKIVNRFSQPESKTPCGGTTAPKNTSLDRKQQEAPRIRPRHKDKIPSAGKAAPQLLKPNLSERKEEPDSKDVIQQEGLTAGVSDGGRSGAAITLTSKTLAPDGKEGGKLTAEQNSSLVPEPRCEKNCSCLCHLHNPGMMLIWVPVGENEDDEGEDDAAKLNPEIKTKDTEKDTEHRTKDTEKEKEQSGTVEEENVCKEVESLSEPVAETENKDEKPLIQKSKFQERRNLIEKQLRNLSDPGPLFATNSVTDPQTPLNVPKGQSLDVQEEPIYELNLVVITPPKPQQGPDGLSSKDPPPAVPPRIPLLVLPRPQILPVPPLKPPTKRSPPDSPRPQKPPPPPPVAKPQENGPRRPSCYSLKSVDENDGKEAAEDKCGSNEKPVRPVPRRQHSVDLEAEMAEGISVSSDCINDQLQQNLLKQTFKTSTDLDQNNAASSERGAEGSSLFPDVKQNNLWHNNLWQDQSAVRDSGVLQTLTPEECMYQESVFEVITSEMSYLRSLRVLTGLFMESSDLSDTLSVRDKKTLFSNIQRIQEVSERFLKDLQERLDENVVISDVCDIIHYHAQHHFPAYVDYVRNQIYQEKIHSNLMQTNSQFAAVITRLQESPKCQRLPFMSFLLLPFQRITRIKILIENILKRTEVGTEKEQTASKALDSVSKIIEECNREVGKMRRMEELIVINGMLEFDRMKAVPIISQTRYLEKRGELQEVHRGGGTFLMLRPKAPLYYLFLFNDLLIIATKKSSERYVVLDHAHRTLVQVQSVEDDTSIPSLQNCFSLTLLENHQGRQVERILKAPTRSDLDRWLAVFPNPNDPNYDLDEVIYEDWDCPQVQCVEQYVAKQADELNLEPTEIVNVLRKTNEGWYEGARLSDGQKGWFPLSNVLEITNEHVRRRNLREHYRIIQAASAIANKSRTLP